MKLKTVFILFNAIVILTFLMVFLMPVFFLGIEFAMFFWRSNWYLVLLFGLVLTLLNAYLVYNWKLFSALENEDWRTIATVLEERVRMKGRYSESNIRLLVNSYVVTARSEAIRELEHHLREVRPDVVERHVLRFGIPHLLSNDGEEITRFFERYRKDLGSNSAAASGRSVFSRWLPGKRGYRDEAYWIEWSYAFGLMLKGDVQEGERVLEAIVSNAPVGIVHGVSLYLLSSRRQQPDDAEALEKRRQAIVRTMSHDDWRKAVEQEQSELHVLVLTKLVGDVERWLYKPEQG